MYVPSIIWILRHNNFCINTNVAFHYFCSYLSVQNTPEYFPQIMVTILSIIASLINNYTLCWNNHTTSHIFCFLLAMQVLPEVPLALGFISVCLSATSKTSKILHFFQSKWLEHFGAFSPKPRLAINFWLHCNSFVHYAALNTSHAYITSRYVFLIFLYFIDVF